MIDIILPIYKPNQKIYEAIDSVFAQTLSNWHLYIVDDASKDNSLLKIKEEYAAYSDKITFFQFEKNQRAAACRNFAIKKASGNFITFIDQDDIWLPNKLELQLNYINKMNSDVVHGNVQFIDSSNKIIMQDKWEKENEGRRQVDWNNLSNIELARKIFIRPNIRIISSMVKREIFETIGGFREQFFGGEDALFWFEIAAHGKIGYLDNCMFYRRLHADNTVKKFSSERLKGKYLSLQFYEKYYFNIVHDLLPPKRCNYLKSIIKSNTRQNNLMTASKYFCYLINHLLLSYIDFDYQKNKFK